MARTKSAETETVMGEILTSVTMEAIKSMNSMIEDAMLLNAWYSEFDVATPKTSQVPKTFVAEPLHTVSHAVPAALGVRRIDLDE